MRRWNNEKTSRGITETINNFGRTFLNKFELFTSRILKSPNIFITLPVYVKDGKNINIYY